MSHQAVNWAITQRVGGPSPKVTLWSIANYANEHWVSWPSQKTIAEESEQSLDTVQRRLRNLEDTGHLRRIPLQYAGRRSIDFFILQPSPFFGSSLGEIEHLFPRGYSVSASHAAAECGSADVTKTPADSNVSGPDAAANAAANAAATVRQHKNLGTKEDDDDGGARARAAYSPEAYKLSADLARVCGHDIEFLPMRWARDGVRIAQAWLDAGYDRDMMIDDAQLIMGRKQGDPPESINYFDKPFGKAHALRSQPHQVVTVNIQPNKPQEVNIHGTRTGSDDFKARKDNWRRVADQLRAAAYGPPETGGSGT